MPEMPDSSPRKPPRAEHTHTGRTSSAATRLCTRRMLVWSGLPKNRPGCYRRVGIAGIVGDGVCVCSLVGWAIVRCVTCSGSFREFFRENLSRKILESRIQIFRESGEFLEFHCVRKFYESIIQYNDVKCLELKLNLRAKTYFLLLA